MQPVPGRLDRLDPVISETLLDDPNFGFTDIIGFFAAQEQCR